MDLAYLAEEAKQAALEGRDVRLMLPWDWERPHGVPFASSRPKQSEADAEGYAPWRWKPHALLMFVFDEARRASNESSQ